MKVNFARRVVRFAALPLAAISVCRAGEVISLDMQPPATTELIVSDDGVAVEPAPVIAAVANNSAPQAPAGVIIDGAVEPTVAASPGNPNPRATVAGWFGGIDGPERPSASAGIQAGSARQAATAPRNAIAVPRNAKPRGSEARHVAAHQAQPLPKIAEFKGPSVALPPRATKPDRAARLLVEAHALSQTAQSQSEYSKIVRNCAEAIRMGLDDDTRPFAVKLSAWALNRRGELRADEDQTELAMADFSAAIEFDKTCWRAFHNRSVSYAQAGQFAEAFDDVSHVIQLNPKFAKAYSNRATLYIQAGDVTKALADYEEALAINPQLTAALVGKARLCHSQGQLSQALIAFDSAIASAEGDAQIVCSRADLLVDLGRYQEAMQDYARAIKLDPRMEHAYRNGAWLLATCPDDEIRDVEGALAGAKKALECGYGDRHAALDTLAAALASAGRFEEAVGTIEQAIEVAPEECKSAYQARLSLYESRQAYRSAPAGEVRAAEYVVGDE